MDILKSSLTGNVIGIVSLLVGLAGLIITIITMKSAKRIEKNINKAKVKALNKSRFNTYRPNALKKLEQKRIAASKTKIITYNMCNDALSIFNDINGFSSVLLDEDSEKIQGNLRRLKEIANSLSSGKKENIYSFQYDSILSEIINILRKGEYDL